jgi:hypothetical protein
MITPLDVVARCRAVLFLVALTCCAGLNSQTYSFATLDEARRAGAIANGWVPEGLPPSSHDIRVAQVPKTSQHWGIINFPRSEESSLRGLLQADEAPLQGEHSDMPARIEWWPVVLRGELDASRVAATGLKAYRSKSGELLFAVNWNQGRAYYWRARGG